MTAIERRRTTVTLYPANIQRELGELLDAAMAAQREEAAGGPLRAGQKRKSMELAREYDQKLTAAHGVEVELTEISRAQWRRLADEHPPRDGDARDALAGVDMSAFPAALLKASLSTSGIDLDELSQLHYMKLENAAWNLHNEDDDLPKDFSLVSLLRQESEPDSKPQPGSE